MRPKTRGEVRIRSSDASASVRAHELVTGTYQASGNKDDPLLFDVLPGVRSRACLLGRHLCNVRELHSLNYPLTFFS